MKLIFLSGVQIHPPLVGRDQSADLKQTCGEVVLMQSA